MEERERTRLETDLVGRRGDAGDLEAERVRAERAEEGAPEAGELDRERASEEAAGEATREPERR